MGKFIFPVASVKEYQYKTGFDMEDMKIDGVKH